MSTIETNIDPKAIALQKTTKENAEIAFEAYKFTLPNNPYLQQLKDLVSEKDVTQQEFTDLYIRIKEYDASHKPDIAEYDYIAQDLYENAKKIDQAQMVIASYDNFTDHDGYSEQDKIQAEKDLLMLQDKEKHLEQEGTEIARQIINAWAAELPYYTEESFRIKFGTVGVKESRNQEIEQALQTASTEYEIATDYSIVDGQRVAGEEMQEQMNTRDLPCLVDAIESAPLIKTVHQMEQCVQDQDWAKLREMREELNHRSYDDLTSVNRILCSKDNSLHNKQFALLPTEYLGDIDAYCKDHPNMQPELKDQLNALKKQDLDIQVLETVVDSVLCHDIREAPYAYAEMAGEREQSDAHAFRNKLQEFAQKYNLDADQSNALLAVIPEETREEQEVAIQINRAKNLPDYMHLMSETYAQFSEQVATKAAQDLADLSSMPHQELMEDCAQKQNECMEKIDALSEYLKYDKDLQNKNSQFEFSIGSAESQLNYTKEILMAIQDSTEYYSQAYTDVQTDAQSVATLQQSNLEHSLDNFNEKTKQLFKNIYDTIHAAKTQYQQEATKAYENYAQHLHHAAVQAYSAIDGIKDQLDQALDTLKHEKEHAQDAYYNLSIYASSAKRLIEKTEIQTAAHIAEVTMDSYRSLQNAKDTLQKAYDLVDSIGSGNRSSIPNALRRETNDLTFSLGMSLEYLEGDVVNAYEALNDKKDYLEEQINTYCEEMLFETEQVIDECKSISENGDLLNKDGDVMFYDTGDYIYDDLEDYPETADYNINTFADMPLVYEHFQTMYEQEYGHCFSNDEIVLDEAQEEAYYEAHATDNEFDTGEKETEPMHSEQTHTTPDHDTQGWEIGD